MGELTGVRDGEMRRAGETIASWFNGMTVHEITWESFMDSGEVTVIWKLPFKTKRGELFAIHLTVTYAELEDEGFDLYAEFLQAAIEYLDFAMYLHPVIHEKFITDAGRAALVQVDVP